MLKDSLLANWALRAASTAEERSFVVNVERKLARSLIRGARFLRYDPPCQMRVPDIQQQLFLPLSHRMPEFRIRYPYYDRSLSRLSELLRSKGLPVGLIDVGANIGDTVLSCNIQQEEKCLAIEPHPAFVQYLRRNVSNLAHCEIVEVACSAARGTTSIASQVGGTARLGSSADFSQGAMVSLMPLDDILESYGPAKNFNILKVDTDGHDLDVLAGANEYLRTERPWILYECDINLTADGHARHLKARSQFQESGYRDALFYKNTGELIRLVSVTDEAEWRSAIACLKEGRVAYYDVLLLRPGTEDWAFSESERRLFHN